MKYLCVVIIILGSGFIGKIIEEKYNKRVKIYNILINFANFTHINIYNLHESIINVINKFIDTVSKEFKNDFEIIKILIINNKVSIENIKKIKMFNDMNNAELLDINNFFNELGKNNLELQISFIENYKHIFEIKHSDAISAKTKKGNISFKMSICIGLMFSIIII